MLNRSFDAGRPNEVWVSDITYLSSRSGWLYLVVFIDLFSRRVVGWCVSTSLAEIELSVLARQCLHSRIPDLQTLTNEVEAWKCDRNEKHRTVDWQFRTTDARIKLKKLYPKF